MSQACPSAALYDLTPHTFLPLGPPCLGWASNLPLPVFAAGQRCTDRPQADITTGKLYALDIAVTATPGTDDCSAAQSRTYGQSKPAPTLPDCHTLAHPQYALAIDEPRSGGILPRPPHTDRQAHGTQHPKVWMPHLASITHQHCANLSHALHISHWRMHDACGRLL